VLVHGDAHVPGEQVMVVVVRLDGRPVGVCTVGEPSPAMAALRGGGAHTDRAGWVLSLGPDDLPDPGVEVEVTAFGVLRSGLVEELDGRRAVVPEPPAPPAPVEPESAPVDTDVVAVADGSGVVDEASEPDGRGADGDDEIEPPAIVGFLDRPDDGHVTSAGVLELSGWVHPPEAVDRVLVRIDAGEPVPARLFAVPRPDLVTSLGDPRAALSGFDHVVDLSGVPVGSTLTVEVTVEGADGVFPVGTREVLVGAASRPTAIDDLAWIDTLSARSALATEPAPGAASSGGVRVLVATHHLGLGGAQLWLHEILTGLLDDPDVSCLVLARRDGPLRERLERAGARVHLLGPLPEDPAEYEARLAELAGLVTAWGCNVAIVNTAGELLTADLAVRCGLPLVWAIHDHFTGPELWHAGHGSFLPPAHLLERRAAALSGAAAVCFVADATRRLYEDDPGSPLPDDPDRRLVVHYGVPLAEFAATAAEYDRAELRRLNGFSADDQVLVCVATVEPRKGQAGLVVALSRLAEEHPHAVVVLVGAAPSPYCDAVRDLGEALGLGERVRFIELTDEVAPWYVMGDAFVLASDVESMPRSIMEAMAHGLPVLATDAGGVAELVQDGATGLCCARRDQHALVDALARLLRLDADGRDRLCAGATAVVHERHDVARYRDDFHRLLRGLAADPAAPPARLLDSPAVVGAAGQAPSEAGPP
jgi:glycosyltransferase involved in cell wall biosynthesis